MNSWRLSSHFWPTEVRNLMPSNHFFRQVNVARERVQVLHRARQDLAEALVLGAALNPLDDRGGKGVFVELPHGLLLRMQ